MYCIYVFDVIYIYIYIKALRAVPPPCLRNPEGKGQNATNGTYKIVCAVFIFQTPGTNRCVLFCVAFGKEEETSPNIHRGKSHKIPPPKKELRMKIYMEIHQKTLVFESFCCPGTHPERARRQKRRD